MVSMWVLASQMKALGSSELWGGLMKSAGRENIVPKTSTAAMHSRFFLNEVLMLRNGRV